MLNLETSDQLINNYYKDHIRMVLKAAMISRKTKKRKSVIFTSRDIKRLLAFMELFVEVAPFQHDFVQKGIFIHNA